MLAWTPPQPVSPHYAQAFMPSIVRTGDGTPVVAWHDGRGAAMAVPGGRARPLPAGALELAPVVPTGRHHVAVAASHALPPSRRRVRLTVRYAKPGGRLGRPAFDVVRRDVSRPMLAGNGRGDLAYAWFENNGVHHDRVYVATRRARHRFGRPRRVVVGQLRNLTVAVDRRGRPMVVWATPGVVHVRYRGRTQTLRSRPAFTQQLLAGFDDHGRAIVAWDAQAVSSGGEIAKGYVQVAVRGAHAARFGRARLLDTIPREVPVNGFALDGDRLAWSGRDGSQYVVRTATVSGPVRDIATGDLHVDGLAGGIVAYTRDRYDDAGTVFAADLADASVTQLSTAPNAREAAIRGDTVVWVQRPGVKDVVVAATASRSRTRAAAARSSPGTPARSR